CRSPVIVAITCRSLPGATPVQRPPLNVVAASTVTVYSPILNCSDGQDVPPTRAPTTPSPSACGRGGGGLSGAIVISDAATIRSARTVPLTPTLRPTCREPHPPPAYCVVASSFTRYAPT